MLQTIYAFALMGTIALWHIFSAAKTEERKQSTSWQSPRLDVPELLPPVAEAVLRTAREELLESPSYRAMSQRVDNNIAFHHLIHYNRHSSVYRPAAPQQRAIRQEPIPMAYRAPQRATSIPRAPLTPAGTLPANRCTECSICMDNSNNSLPACRIGMCGHVFHTGCLRPWLAQNPTCPNCRTVV